ncbi:hypothetical protein PC116_g6332 [Phytophthora cactorum]|nr:hypothetical protein PC114_g5375 [Phytophthora cactorum]KAG4245857.1 hypothetical protein PC116_g6332 [Phytophthora cactorum]
MMFRHVQDHRNGSVLYDWNSKVDYRDCNENN